MLDQLLQLVREQAQGPVVNNPAVPNEQNDAVINEATHTVAAGLQEELAQGNASQVLGLLGGKSEATEQNPVVNRISGSFADTLLQKFNLNAGTAKTLAASLIPSILGSLASKTNDPNNSNFSLQNILNSLTGGQAQGLNLQGILGKLGSGLDRDGDGDVDLQDLTSMLSSGARQQQQQQQSQEGGIGGMLKSLLG